ncbi:MAG: fatty acid--CoA ligase family protein, partial [Clostridiales bacterium]
GKPKTIVLAAVQLNTLAAQISYILGEGSHRGEKALSVLPFFHGFGLCLGLHGLLIHGMAGVLLAKFHKEEATRLIIEHKIEYLLGVPNIFAALLAAKGFHGEDLSFIKGCFVGGDSINPQLRQAFNSHLAQNGSQASLQEGYGLTEMVTVAAVNRQSSHKDGSVGQALPGIKVKICALADDEGGFASLPLGQEGEICLCGLTMMLGYLDDPMATAQTIRSHEDGELWVHTGDWGYLDADDFLWFRQRIKRMIKIGGFNIFPSEVENCLLDLDFIREACAIAIEDEGKIQGIKVFLSLNREMAEEEAQNLADQYCRKQLPFWSLPSYWEICPALPLTSVGKADFHALEKMEKARVK